MTCDPSENTVCAGVTTVVPSLNTTGAVPSAGSDAVTANAAVPPPGPVASAVTFACADKVGMSTTCRMKSTDVERPNASRPEAVITWSPIESAVPEARADPASAYVTGTGFPAASTPVAASTTAATPPGPVARAVCSGAVSTGGGARFSGRTTTLSTSNWVDAVSAILTVIGAPSRFAPARSSVVNVTCAALPRPAALVLTVRCASTVFPDRIVTTAVGNAPASSSLPDRSRSSWNIWYGVGWVKVWLSTPPPFRYATCDPRNATVAALVGAKAPTCPVPVQPGGATDVLLPLVPSTFTPAVPLASTGCWKSPSLSSSVSDNAPPPPASATTR